MSGRARRKRSGKVLRFNANNAGKGDSEQVVGCINVTLPDAVQRRSGLMRMKKRVSVALILGASLAVFLLVSGRAIVAGQAGNGAVAIDNDDIGGVVTGARGPEAGVWVVAETRSTPTRLIKSVVTDDQGRYLVPDLPSAEYDVWVRGYGLVDSPKVKSAPGKLVNLKAVAAPDKKAAAQYYPAQFWYALMQVPPVTDVP